jgi:hypothetical protein
MRPHVALFLLLLVSPLLAAEPNQPILSHISRQPVDSSAIMSIGYSKRQHALEIEFRNGAIYRYFDVPAPTYRDLMAASSKARYYDDNIRHHFHSVHVKPRR